MISSNNSKPSVKEGLERGAKGTRRMASHPQGRRVLLYVVGSMFWIFFLTPSACMKLEETFPKTGAGVIVGLAMYVVWVAFLVITRKKRGF